MSCADYRHDIVDLARGVLPTAHEPRVRAHVAECHACAALLAGERALSTAMRGLAENAAAERASDALEERLVATFEKERLVTTFEKERLVATFEKEPLVATFEEHRLVTMVEAVKSVAPSRSSAAGQWWIPLAAALVLAAGSVAWWRGGGLGTSVPGSVPGPIAATRAADPVPPPSPAVAAGAPARTVHSDGGPAAKGPAVSTRRRPHVLRPVGFVAIPTATGLPDFESGEIVRTRIPVSSLPVYGVEIPPDAAGTPVEADLLVGQDGQARAIRLVTSDSRTTRSRQ